ncbi:MAG TPA: type II toxin-antitoxin system VapC family toxin [Chloroflexota bacterium]|nr:type II toxin-antitoxin system VapC family toxin [Chloroflexota bacterium]
MAASLVVDASVAIKWYLEEEDRELARRLITGEPERPLIAPDLIVAEIGNILWKRHRQGSLTAADAARLAEAPQDPRRFPLDLVPSTQVLPQALRIAVECDRSVYDSLYIALAVANNTAMITADARLANALSATPYAANVRLLRDA